MIKWNATSNLTQVSFSGEAKNIIEAKKSLADKTSGMTQTLKNSFVLSVSGSAVFSDEKISGSLSAIDHGALCLAKIRSVNKSKLESGAWTSSKFQSLLTNQEAAAIERALWTGSFQTATSLIQNFSGDFYSPSEKTEIISLISSFTEV